MIKLGETMNTPIIPPITTEQVKLYMDSGFFANSVSFAVELYIHSSCLYHGKYKQHFMANITEIAEYLEVEYWKVKDIVRRSEVVGFVYSPVKGKSYFKILKELKP